MKKETVKTVKKKEEKIVTMKQTKFRRNLQLFSLALPGYILCIIFCFLPMIGNVIAFQDFNPIKGLFGSEWVGFDNFKFIFKSGQMFKLIRNTVAYEGAYLILNITCNLLVAYAFYNVKSKRAVKVFQGAIMFPRFISVVLVAFIVYAFLHPTSGILNQIITATGGKAVNWYAKPSAWPFILPIVEVWCQLGAGSMLYYACMVGIDASLFEAAALDGATSMQRLRYIIIPELRPLIALGLIKGIGSIISGNTGLHYQVTMDVPNLYPTTDILNTYILRAVASGSALERTAAVGLFMSVVGSVMLIATNAVVRKVDPDSAMF